MKSAGRIRIKLYFFRISTKHKTPFVFNNIQDNTMRQKIRASWILLFCLSIFYSRGYAQDCDGPIVINQQLGVTNPQGEAGCISGFMSGLESVWTAWDYSGDRIAWASFDAEISTDCDDEDSFIAPFNINDLTSPSAVSSKVVFPDASLACATVNEGDRRMYLTTTFALSGTNGTFWVLNLTDFSSPSIVGLSFNEPGSIGFATSVVEDVNNDDVYVCYGSIGSEIGGAYVYDISDPTSPTPTSLGFNCSALALRDSVLYVSDIVDGVLKEEERGVFSFTSVIVTAYALPSLTVLASTGPIPFSDDRYIRNMFWKPDEAILYCGGISTFTIAVDARSVDTSTDLAFGDQFFLAFSEHSYCGSMFFSSDNQVLGIIDDLGGLNTFCLAGDPLNPEFITFSDATVTPFIGKKRGMFLGRINRVYVDTTEGFALFPYPQESFKKEKDYTKQDILTERGIFIPPDEFVTWCVSLRGDGLIDCSEQCDPTPGEKNTLDFACCDHFTCDFTDAVTECNSEGFTGCILANAECSGEDSICPPPTLKTPGTVCVDGTPSCATSTCDENGVCVVTLSTCSPVVTNAIPVVSSSSKTTLHSALLALLVVASTLYSVLHYLGEC